MQRQIATVCVCARVCMCVNVCFVNIVANADKYRIYQITYMNSAGENNFNLTIIHDERRLNNNEKHTPVNRCSLEQLHIFYYLDFF